MLTGCATNKALPNRIAPETLDVKQSSYITENGKSEYILCSPGKGPWGCEKPTKKTLITSIEKTNKSDLNKLIKPVIASKRVEKIVYNKHDEVMPPNKNPELEIYFEFDTYILSNESKKTLIEFKEKNVLEGSEIEVVLHGYTDSFGGVKYNNWLGKKRANITRNFLESIGFAGSKIKTHGHGMCCYVVKKGSTKEDQKLNRRVEIYVSE